MGMSGVAIFFVVLVVLLLAAAAGWVGYTQWRARKLGLPAPTLASYNPFSSSPTNAYGQPRPAPGGVVGWVNDRMRGFKNRKNRTADGAYEPDYNRRAALDPDDAWDARVGNEADGYGYYEEQELGLREPARGRSYNRETVPEPYAGAQGHDANPFDDHAEPSQESLRGVSPRPDTGRHSRGGSPSSTRRSVFQEGI